MNYPPQTTKIEVEEKKQHTTRRYNDDDVKGIPLIFFLNSNSNESVDSIVELGGI